MSSISRFLKEIIQKNLANVQFNSTKSVKNNFFYGGERYDDYFQQGKYSDHGGYPLDFGGIPMDRLSKEFPGLCRLLRLISDYSPSFPNPSYSSEYDSEPDDPNVDPGELPIEPDDPNVDPNTLPNLDTGRQSFELSGTATQGRRNVLIATEQNSGKSLSAEPGTGAIFNNLRGPVNADLKGSFAGYIGGFGSTEVRGSGGGINAVVHAFDNFGAPTDRDPEGAKLDVNLQPGDQPNRIAALGGQGSISGVEFLTLQSTRSGGENNSFDVRGAQEVRIVALEIEQVEEGVWRDERGTIYRINPEAEVTATGTRDRESAESTFEQDGDVPGPDPGFGAFIRGVQPHDGFVIAPDGSRLDADQILPQ